MDPNWKSFFPKDVLYRGQMYFLQNKIQSVKEYDDYFMATIKGSMSYVVKIYKELKNIRSSTCTCPYANLGYFCKHEAALYYYAENQNESGKSSHEKKDVSRNYITSKELFPNDENQYHFYDMQVIAKNLKIHRNDLKFARELIESGKIKEKFHDFDGLEPEFVAEYTSGGISSDIKISIQGSEINKISCSVKKCGATYWKYIRSPMNEKICCHGIAALLLLNEFIERENPGDSTDYNAKKLFKLYDENSLAEEKKVKVQVDESRLIKLVPRVKNYGKYLSAGFRIGHGKLFVVKDLKDIVTAEKSRGIFALGKSDTLDFSKDVFDEDGKKYYEFLKAIIENRIAQDEIERNVRAQKENEVVNLYGKRLDDFFELSNGRTIAYENCSFSHYNKDFSEISFADGKINVKLKIIERMNSKNQFTGLYVKGTLPDFLVGADHRYWIEDGKLLRLDKTSSRNIAALESLSMLNEISFFVGRKNLTRFVYHVLPWLKTFADVEEPSYKKLGEFLAPKPEFKFYFDAEEDCVYLSTQVFYGEKKYVLYSKENSHKEEFRDLQDEENVENEIAKYFNDENRDEEKCFTNDENSIFELLNSGLEKFMSFGEINVTESFKKITINKRVKISVNSSISQKSKLFELEIKSDDLTNEQLLEILDGMKKKKKFVRLSTGSFFSTEDESLEELSDLMENLQISQKEFLKSKINIPSFRMLYLDKILEEKSAITFEKDRETKKLIKEFKTVSDSDFEVPEPLSKIMRSYQVEGHKWMRTLKEYGFGGILADDMGLGKTLQTISVLLSAKENGFSGTSLIVTPSSLVYNWKNEFEKFAPEMKIGVVAGNSSNRIEKISECGNYDVLVTSYDLLKRDFAEYEEKNFLYEVIDEGQYIKNSTTVAAKAVKSINAKYRLALTGTPIENRLSELWSIFDFLMPGFLYKYDDFKKRFEIPIVKNTDAKTADALKKMISPFIMRRLKKDVLKDLPEKIEEIRYAHFDEAQQKLYDAEVVKIRKMLDEKSETDFNKGRIQILAELTRIRQICCDPSLVYENFEGGSAKKDACIELIKSGIDSEHKMLVFSQFTSMLSILEEELTKENISFYKITGDTPKEKRMELVNLFNNDDTSVFLISLKAGGTGLNLTGADTVIHYDPWWNLAVQNQATDRAYRIGQKKNVCVYKLIAKNSIEEKLVNLQDSKKNLAEEILSGENGTISLLSREDILELLDSNSRMC